MKFHFRSSGAPHAVEAFNFFTNRYRQYDIGDCDVIISLGGDGFLLETLHFLSQNKINIPVFGMNRGSLGFLLNTYDQNDLEYKVSLSKTIILHPLKMDVETVSGEMVSYHGYNDIYLSRQSRQAAKIEVKINGKVRIPEIVSDGIILSTPAGSTSYNKSAGGPIVPLDSNILPLTPICAFRPRNWSGALLHSNSNVEFTVHESEKRPVSATADSSEVHNVKYVNAYLDNTFSSTLLFTEEDCLAEKVFSEQFF